MATSLKARAADRNDETVKKKDLYPVDPRALSEEPGFNLRDYADPAVVAHIEGFADSFEQGLYVPPIIVRVDDDGKIMVIEGHCRRRGALLAISRGVEVPYLDAVQFRGNDVERIELMLRSQEGLKFTPLKLAEGYLSLERRGRTVAEIAKRVSRSRTHVESLLILARANLDVQKLVATGKVNAQAAIDAVRQHGEKAGAFLAGKYQDAVARGKRVVSQDAVKEWAPPRKHAGALYGSLSSVVTSLKTETRRQLAEIEKMAPEARAGRTIEVDAAAFLELFNVHVATTEFRTSKEAKGKDAKAAAAQQTLDIDASPAGKGAQAKPATTRKPAKVIKSGTYSGPAADDPVLKDARELVIEDQRPTISYVQRKLQIGYNRAASLLEQLEREGVVSRPDDQGDRKVLTTV